ncbi:hypothetical protein [Roseivivax marinus]|uniref:hypothetical protein n=1 Tax=Roseivivax marinus TaxID=1379903 RepID=UPI00273DAC2E|nr:hypothetical protein [Roseivivax marinus]
MEHVDQSHFACAKPAATALTAPDYINLLHPPCSFGKLTLMAKDGAGAAHAVTHTTATAPLWVNCFLDGDGYVSLHRFHGPRRVDRLAALNGLFLDLDVDRLPHNRDRSAGSWADDVTLELLKLQLPEPTILLSTGRGLAAIWLINPLPPQALPRWQSAQNVLVDLFNSLGADPRCRDAARVTRLPGSLNTKCGREARILSGALRRYDFDQLSDDIYVAAGRPTRQDLRKRKERPKKRKEGMRTGGLPPAARFAAVLRDLERLRIAWGGLVPEGSRNTWLHLYATCLSHTSEPTDIARRVEDMAAVATPGLPRSEVAPIVKLAVRHASLPAARSPRLDGRYHYSGATLAELLGVTAEAANTLGLEQIMPKAERARRKTDRECARRRAAGALPRDEWLEKNSCARRKPWVDMGISKSTFYRRRRAGELVDAVQPPPVGELETGPCPQQGGSAQPKAQVEGRSPSTITPSRPERARSRTRPAQAINVTGTTRPLAHDEIVVETHPYVQPSLQQGEIDFAGKRILCPPERYRAG